MKDYAAAAQGVDGRVKAFTTGTLECCRAAAQCYKRKKDGLRVYPAVKIMDWEEWAAEHTADQMEMEIETVHQNF